MENDFGNKWRRWFSNNIIWKINVFKGTGYETIKIFKGFETNER